MSTFIIIKMAFTKSILFCKIDKNAKMNEKGTKLIKINRAHIEMCFQSNDIKYKTKLSYNVQQKNKT